MALVKPRLLPPDTPPADPQGPVGVVIPAYNNAATIVEAIESLRAQVGVQVDLVVVDDASTDETASVAEKAGARVLRRKSNGGPSAARNQGARAVVGNFLFFAEADGRYAPDYLQTCLRAMADERVGASIATGIKAWTTRDNAVVRLGDAIWAAAHSLVMEGKRGTGAWCYRREVFEKLGGFDETKRHGEDTHLAGKVESLGRCTGVAGWSTLEHKNPDTLALWWKRACRGTRAAAIQEKFSPIGLAAKLLKLGALLIVPAGLAAALIHSGWWLAPVIAVLAAVTLESPELRLTLRFLLRRRDWRTLAIAPFLLWLRRLAFVYGHLQGRFDAQ